MLLDGIDLRYLRIGGTELVRRVYAAVRDVDWDTVPGVVSGLEIEESDDGFRVEFDVRHARREVDFAWHGTIIGTDTGRIEYVFDGCAGAAFPFGRIGLCVHHPWRETAGARFTARTPDGDIDGAFPDLIGPQSFDGKAFSPLFPSFDHLEVELADGGRLVLDFEGDLWETEDHRNWTDANFKTYSTPISLGPPPPLEPGQALRQRLVIEPVDVSAGMPSSGRARLTIGAPTETVVPPVGLGQDRDHHVARSARARGTRAARRLDTCVSSCDSTATGVPRSRRHRRLRRPPAHTWRCPSTCSNRRPARSRTSLRRWPPVHRSTACS